jgi:hypothetical protein
MNAGGNAGATTTEGGMGGEGGAPVVPPPPPAPVDPNVVVVTRASPTTFNHALVTGTDFATQGEVASIKLDSGTIDDSTVYPDTKGDVATQSSGGLGFALQRTSGTVNLLDGSKIKTTFDVNETGSKTAVDVANKAYVSSLNYNFISILDLQAGTVADRIDISQFMDPKDADGSVNTSAGAYDSAKKIAYFVLGRIDLTSFDSNFNLPCNGTKALVIGIDATTDQLVDLNGAADGEAISLFLANPQAATLSADGKSLTVLATGCYDGAQDKQGVEVVHLDTASSTVAYAPTDGSTPNDLIVLDGGQALIQTAFGAKYNKLDLTTGVLGAELEHMPDGAAFDGTDLIGVTLDTPNTVVRYTVATDTATTVVTSPWTGTYIYTAPTTFTP